MKKILLLVVLAISLVACTDRNVSVKISGDIQDGGNKKIRLALITANGMDIIDSTTMHNGHFEFKLSSENELIKERENSPMMFQLFLTEENSLATMAKKGEELNTYAYLTLSKIIAGEETVDYFDVFVSEWKSTGGDDITREVNEWYKNITG